MIQQTDASIYQSTVLPRTTIAVVRFLDREVYGYFEDRTGAADWVSRQRYEFENRRGKVIT